MSDAQRFSIPDASIEAPHSARFEVQKSHFIGLVARCETVDEAHSMLHSVRAAYPDARHHCSAFIAGPPGEQTALGFSDDGEPGGTAGRPIYQVLEGSGLGQIGCVVVRYFGGIKLGTGGLVRAYTKAALLALEELPLQGFVNRRQIRLRVDFSDEFEARYWSEQAGALVSQVDYSARGPILQLAWPADTPLDINALALKLNRPPQLLDESLIS